MILCVSLLKVRKFIINPSCKFGNLLRAGCWYATCCGISNLLWAGCWYATCFSQPVILQLAVHSKEEYKDMYRTMFVQGGLRRPHKCIVKYISLYSSSEWTAGCKITGCEKQVAYQQPTHSRLHISNLPTAGCQICNLRTAGCGIARKLN